MRNALASLLCLIALAGAAVAQQATPMVGSGGPMIPSGQGSGGGGGPSGPPTVTALAPSGGSTAGGTPVVVTGTNFQSVSAVVFGTNAATSFTYLNPNTIDATAPAGSAGTINVTVTTPLGTSATGAGNAYTYAAAGCSNSMDFSQPCNTQYGF